MKKLFSALGACCLGLGATLAAEAGPTRIKDIA